jgi:hypothetical protein
VAAVNSKWEGVRQTARLSSWAIVLVVLVSRAGAAEGQGLPNGFVRAQMAERHIPGRSSAIRERSSRIARRFTRHTVTALENRCCWIMPRY